MRLKNILVPIDFSDCSDNALHYAIALAQRSDAKLTLLNCYVVHVPAAEVTMDIQPSLAIDYQKNAERNFSRLREKEPDLAKVEHEEVIKVSFVIGGILETAEVINADMIIMGTTGADNRIDVFFGTNTYGIIKKSEIPVLAVPKNARFQPISKILFAADFKHIEDTEGLEIIKTMALLFKSRVEILHVGHSWSELNMNQTNEAAAIVEYFGHSDHSYHFIKEKVDVETAIDDHLAIHKNELLVLIARKHRFPGSLFKKKITRRAAMHTDVPLLTIPDLR